MEAKVLRDVRVDDEDSSSVLLAAAGDVIEVEGEEGADQVYANIGGYDAYLEVGVDVELVAAG